MVRVHPIWGVRGDFWVRFLGLEARSLATLLEAQRDIRGSPLLYIEGLFVNSIAHFMKVSLLVRSVIPEPLPMA